MAADSAQYNALIRGDLLAYLHAHPQSEVVEQQENGIVTAADRRVYTASPWYQVYTLTFHDDVWVSRFIDMLANNMTAEATFLDVGCCNGATGLVLALMGRNVTFYDYEGLGLSFVRDFIARHELTAHTSVVPYGVSLPHCDIAIALDVLEHTSSHTAALRWWRELGTYVAISYPLASYRPPYIIHLDEYVDDEAILLVAERRYEIIFNEIRNMRRFMVYQ